MAAFFILVLAAALESGGDALVRVGVRTGRIGAMMAGAGVLFAYGVTVNLPKWDFGRLLGVYIAVFFVVAQVIAVTAFHEPMPVSRVAGGALVVAGGLLMTFWK